MAYGLRAVSTHLENVCTATERWQYWKPPSLSQCKAQILPVLWRDGDVFDCKSSSMSTCERAIELHTFVQPPRLRLGHLQRGVHNLPSGSKGTEWKERVDSPLHSCDAMSRQADLSLPLGRAIVCSDNSGRKIGELLSCSDAASSLSTMWGKIRAEEFRLH